MKKRSFLWVIVLELAICLCAVADLVLIMPITMIWNVLWSVIIGIKYSDMRNAFCATFMCATYKAVFNLKRIGEYFVEIANSLTEEELD